MGIKNYTLIITITLISIFSCSQQSPELKYKPLVEKYVNYWNSGTFDGIEDVLHPNFELRMTPKYESEEGISLFRENVIKWRTAYPDFHIELEEVFYSENAAAAIWQITATNTGDGWHPATGKSINITGMSIIHFKDGKIKDEWIASNNGYWLKQLGFELVSPFEG